MLIAAGAVPGDRLEVVLDHETRTARFGRIVRVVQPSPDRVPPRCPGVGLCGGCVWQAIAYPRQLQLKHEALLRAVRGVASLKKVPVGDVVPVAPEPYGIRTKIQMPVGGRPGALVIGFYRPHTHEIVEVDGCAVQHPEGNRIVAEAREVLNRARIAPYDERRHDGVLRYLLLRLDGTGQRAALTLVVRTDKIPGRSKIADRLAAIRGVSGVYMNVQPAKGNVVLGRRTDKLAGRERLLVEAGGKRFLLSPTAFFQTSMAGAETLVRLARKHLPGPYRTLVDLYCGVGLFARTLADRAERVIAVEENRAAIDDAMAGARLDGDESVYWLAAPAEAWAERDAPAADAVLVDPPRAGCDPRLLQAIAGRLRPKKLCYVSCNPETLLRDLDALSRLGYRTTAIEPVDMFPHTPHLECVAAVERG